MSDQNEAVKSEDTDEPKFWLDNPANVNLFFKILYVVCGLSVLSGLVLTVWIKTQELAEHHPEHDLIDKWPFSYSLYGFAAIVLLIVVAKTLRKFVMRGEDYYD